MYETLKRLYQAGRATTSGIRQATAKGWLTKDQYKELTGEEYIAPENKFGLSDAQAAELEQDTINKIITAVAEEE